ncbi:MAG: sodium:proton exchanger [Acidobacteriota bacterium]|nr:sodium:proton exchanger [Acidobacteriota bacterium]
MKKFVFYVALAVAATLPGLIVRLTGTHLATLPTVVIFFAAILGAGFLLSWGAEAAEQHVSRGLAVAFLALITVLPEYAVDIYFSYQAGLHPDSQYVGFAAANMTGANRLLVGTGWSLIVFLFWWRSGRRGVQLFPQNSAEIVFLALSSVYAFVIVIKNRIDVFDTVFLGAIFAAYLWRVSRTEKDDDDDDEIEVGPAAILETLPKKQQYTAIAALAVYAAFVIIATAEPFAESLIAGSRVIGINEFLVIQWIAPLAGESPEIIITILFTLALRPTIALGALISDKINQWTLLVGMIPLAYSLGAGTLSALPLDARQQEEFFLTAAQSLFGLALLLCLRLSLTSAFALLGLFLVQFGLAFYFHNDESRTITILTYMAWLYLALAAGIFIWNYRCLIECFRTGLLARARTEIIGATLKNDE